jgi:hypothetical protein
VIKTFRFFLLCISCVALLSCTALADEWNKTYQVGDKPSLRVETNDASIEISRGVSRTISARVITEGYKIGNADVRVTDRQSGDGVDLQVHIPNEWGVHMGWRTRRVKVEVQVPSETALDLHSSDGHINVNGTTGPARIDTGDGSIEVRDFSGSIKGHTGDGHMTIDGVLSDVDLRTGDGHVDLTARPGSKMNAGWLIHTSDGHVEARLPQDFAAELYAHTGDGRIPVTVNGSIERSRIRGKLNGGGPLLEITTGDGNIRISKY